MDIGKADLPHPDGAHQPIQIVLNLRKQHFGHVSPVALLFRPFLAEAIGLLDQGPRCLLLLAGWLLPRIVESPENGAIQELIAITEDQRTRPDLRLQRFLLNTCAHCRFRI